MNLVDKLINLRLNKMSKRVIRLMDRKSEILKEREVMKNTLKGVMPINQKQIDNYFQDKIYFLDNRIKRTQKSFSRNLERLNKRNNGTVVER